MLVGIDGRIGGDVARTARSKSREVYRTARGRPAVSGSRDVGAEADVLCAASRTKGVVGSGYDDGQRTNKKGVNSSIADATGGRRQHPVADGVKDVVGGV